MTEPWKYAFEADAEEVEEANRREAHSPKDSITNGENSWVGYLAQIVAAVVLDIPETHTHGNRQQEFNADLMDGSDVKACLRTVAAERFHCGHISLSQRRQQWQRGIFASVYQDEPTKVWIVELCGEITKPEWMARARFVRQGEVDPMDPDPKPKKMLVDCHNLLYSEMRPVDLGRGPRGGA